MSSSARLLRALALAGAALAVAAWVAVALQRAAYPFELEWQEGGMLAHVRRVLAGQALFVQPDAEFAPFPYPPLYAWTAALAARAVGEGFLALRLVSDVATLATAGLLFDLARRRGGAGAGLVAAGLYVGAFRWGGAWFDLARVDALALACALAAVHRAAAGRAVAAGAWSVAALLAKQTTLLVTAPLLLTCLATSRRSAARFTAVLGLGGAAAFGWLHVASDGRSTWTLFTQLAAHPTYAPKVLGFWTEDVPLVLPGLALAVLGLARDRAARARLLPPAVGGLAAAWLGRAHIGGYDNVLLPLALAVALLGARAWDRGGSRFTTLSAALLLAQLAAFAYDPRAALPRPGDRAAGERAVQRLAAVEGEVFAPYHGYLAVRAGKRDTVHAMALFDLSAAGPAGEAHALPLLEKLAADLAAGRYAGVLLAEPQPFEAWLGERYGPRERWGPEGELATVTGVVRAPAWWYPRR